MSQKGPESAAPYACMHKVVVCCNTIVGLCRRPKRISNKVCLQLRSVHTLNVVIALPVSGRVTWIMYDELVVASKDGATAQSHDSLR